MRKRHALCRTNKFPIHLHPVSSYSSSPACDRTQDFCITKSACTPTPLQLITDVLIQRYTFFFLALYSIAYLPSSQIFCASSAIIPNTQVNSVVPCE